MIVELGFIYYLKNKQTNEIFYVGSTESSLKNRLTSHYHHLNEVKNGKRKSNKRFDYLIKLLPEKPSIHLIELVINEDLSAREKFYINLYSKDNILTNMTIGGPGGNTYSNQDSENKLLISSKISSKLKNIKRSKEFKDNLSVKRIGLKNPMAGRSKVGWIVCNDNLLFKYGYEINNFLNNKNAYGNISKNIKNKTKKAYGHKWKLYDEYDQKLQDIVQTSYESLKK